MTEVKGTNANCGRNLIASAIVAAMGLLILTGRPLSAAQAKKRTVSVTINKGETYVITDVRKDAAPGIKVADNPNALVVRTDEPGKIVLVGSDAGSWNLDVTLANGEKVTYAVNVKAAAPPQGSLVPGSAPTVIP
jgi:hypothetical protein